MTVGNTTEKSRPRLLLSAFAFDSAGGSEAGLGWKIAKGLSAEYDVTVLTGNLRSGPKNAQLVKRTEQACAENGAITQVVIEGNRRAKRLAKLSGRPGCWWLYYQGYREWQNQAYIEASVLHADRPFDLCHHLNYIGFREPGYLWKLGIPHFWGPISGSPMVPLAFLKTFSVGQIYRWGGRNIGNFWQMRFSRRCKVAAAASAKIWAVSQTDRDMVVDQWNADADELLETGCEIGQQVPVRKVQLGEPLRFVWSGRFDPIKVLPLVLEALIEVKDQPWELHVLGDGPEACRWAPLILEGPMRERIKWHGMVDRDTALQVMNRAHVLLHSSVKEGTPHVVLEALSLGLPVVCHDACGMGVAVDESCGIKVPLVNPEASVDGFRGAIQRLLTEPGLVEALSAGAGRRARSLSWETKVAAFSSAYREALQDE